MSYSVNLWASHPKNGNDDCITGTDVETLREAISIRENLSKHFRKDAVRAAEWIEIDGPDHNSCERNKGYVPSDDDRDYERRERAMEAGMLHGIGAYNEAMGYDVEQYDPEIHGGPYYDRD